MRKKILVVVGFLSAVALAAAAAPALPADTGSVVGTVSVAAAPAPCITLNTSSVDFGTQSFSDPAAASTPFAAGSPAIHATSCSTAGENILFSAGDATTASGGVWHVATTPHDNTCTLGTNQYEPWSFLANGNGNVFYSTPTANPLIPTVAPGAGTDFTFKLRMPCRGSAGAGETATMTFTTTAVLA